MDVTKGGGITISSPQYSEDDNEPEPEPEQEQEQELLNEPEVDADGENDLDGESGDELDSPLKSRRPSEDLSPTRERELSIGEMQEPDGAEAEAAPRNWHNRLRIMGGTEKSPSSRRHFIRRSGDFEVGKWFRRSGGGGLGSADRDKEGSVVIPRTIPETAEFKTADGCYDSEEDLRRVDSLRRHADVCACVY